MRSTANPPCRRRTRAAFALLTCVCVLASATVAWAEPGDAERPVVILRTGDFRDCIRSLLPIGVPAWRQVGVERALRAHARGEPLGAALRREVPRALSQGFVLAGGTVLLGSALLVVPPTIVAATGGSTVTPGWYLAAFTPHVSVGVAFLVSGAFFALPLRRSATELLVSAPIPIPSLVVTPSGAMGGLSFAF